MDNYLKFLLNEAFKSVAQQKLFFAKANDKTLPNKERKKWKQMSNEFKKETNFKKLPNKTKEKELEEIVDDNGVVMRSKKPSDFGTKYITQKRTTDDVIKTGANMMGNYGTTGVQNFRRYAGEIYEVELSGNLGADDTILKDLNFNQAYRYFKNELKLNDDEIKEKMKQLGYSEELPKDNVYLIEYTKEQLNNYFSKKIKK